MFPKTIVTFLVVACVAYIECRPPYGDAIKRSLINTQAFDDLIEQILQQVNSQQATPISSGESGVFRSQEVQYVQDTPVTNRDALKASIFNSEALSKWVQQVWQQVVEQYQTLTAQTTQSTQEVQPSTTPAEVVTVSQAQITTQEVPTITTTSTEVVTSSHATQSPQEVAEVVTITNATQSLQETPSSTTTAAEVVTNSQTTQPPQETPFSTTTTSKVVINPQTTSRPQEATSSTVATAAAEGIRQ